jgi:hypothetical protein
MNSGLRWIVYFCAVAVLAGIAVAASRWGASEVRADQGEIIFVTAMGGVWMLGAHLLFPWLGVSLRDDVEERRNAAAAVALCGALLATGIIYAGGSAGNGPSYFENFFSAGLGMAAMFTFWVLLGTVGNLSASVTEDRDMASGIRLAAFLMSVGLIFARALAGNWHSVGNTVHDFIVDGWPAVVVLMLAAAMEKICRPTRARPFPSWPLCGLLPALLYLGLAVGWGWHLGRWEGMP